MKKGCISLLFALFVVVVLGIFALPRLIDSALRLYYPQAYKEIVTEKTAAFELEESLVYAVIHAESKFDPAAESHAGAAGLMQLTEETFVWINGKFPSETAQPDIMNPSDNIYAGCALLRLLITHYGDLTVALSAYNAGMGNVDAWLQNEQYSKDGVTLDKIPFPETEKYVARVLTNYEMYKKLYTNNA